MKRIIDLMCMYVEMIELVVLREMLCGNLEEIVDCNFFLMSKVHF